MELKCRIKGRTYNIVIGASFSEEFNETLDSGSIIIPHVKKIADLAPYDDVYIWNADEDFDGYYNQGDMTPDGIATQNSSLPSFFKHLLVDDFEEEMLTLDDNKSYYTYTIRLMSETRGLDMVPCPNVSITQSLVVEERRSCAYYLEQFINLYSPKMKRKSVSDNTWYYQNKYKLDPRLEDEDENQPVEFAPVTKIFKNIDCPEMSFTNPTLRDILSQIMNVCDCIPIVRNGVIYAMKISETRGVFRHDGNHTNFIHSGMNSGDFATAARREYSEALSRTTTQCVEYLGFRNREDALMTIENMYIETRFPIYKINKLYLCYFKKISVYLNDDDLHPQETTFLCKHNIADLVLTNNVRNCLSADWSTYPNQIDERKDMSNYKVLTLGYDIGDTRITGWGTKYQYASVAWYSETRTYLQNILNLLEAFSPYGDAISFHELKQRFADVDSYSFMSSTWDNAMVAPLELSSDAIMKGMFFQIDYEAMYDGAIVHSKENATRDDIAIVDNQSSALTITEKDGLFEYEKLKRLGNRNVKIQCRYKSVEEMNDDYNNNIGTIFDNNIIIYHKEYQIYDEGVLANFVGTYNYVLKNYFTSVFARLRMYNYMSYGESVKRTENIKYYLVLSLDTLYWEETPDCYISKDLFLTAVKETDYDNDLFAFVNDAKIDFGFFAVEYPERDSQGRIVTDGNGNPVLHMGYFKSDLQRLVSGYSLCFDIKMFDNIAGGLYIKHWQATYNKPGVGELNVEPYSAYDDIVSGSNIRMAKTLKGSLQDWYLLPSSLTDAFIETIGLYIGKGVQPFNMSVPASVDEIQNNIYPNFLDKLPKTNESYDSGEYWGSSYNLCKDNKELIDATFQIELFNNSVVDLADYSKPAIVVSNWFMKLNDLYGQNIKSSVPRNYADYETEANFEIEMLYGYAQHKQVIVLRIKDEFLRFVEAGASILTVMLLSFNRCFSHGYPFQYLTFVQPTQIINVESNSIVVRCEVFDYEQVGNPSEHPLDGDYVLDNRYTANLRFTKDTQPADGYTDYKFFGFLPPNQEQSADLKCFSNETKKGWQLLKKFPEHSGDATVANAIFIDKIYLSATHSGEAYIINKPKNMFVTCNDKYMNNDIRYKTYASTTIMEQDGYKFYPNNIKDIISIVDNNKIRIKLYEMWHFGLTLFIPEWENQRYDVSGQVFVTTKMNQSSFDNIRIVRHEIPDPFTHEHHLWHEICFYAGDEYQDGIKYGNPPTPIDWREQECTICFDYPLEDENLIEIFESVGATNNKDYNSIQYWFFNDKNYTDTEHPERSQYFGNENGSNLFNFVIGVNITEEMKQRGYVDIYASLIKSKGEMVKDYRNNEIYSNVNYLEHPEFQYGSNNLCIEIVPVGPETLRYFEVGDPEETSSEFAPVYSIVGDETEEIYEINSYLVI